MLRTLRLVDGEKDQDSYLLCMDDCFIKITAVTATSIVRARTEWPAIGFVGADAVALGMRRDVPCSAQPSTAAALLFANLRLHSIFTTSPQLELADIDTLSMCDSPQRASSPAKPFASALSIFKRTLGSIKVLNKFHHAVWCMIWAHGEEPSKLFVTAIHGCDF